MTDLEKLITTEIDLNEKEIINLRRYFHMNPELPTKEYNTASYIEKELNSLGLETKRIDETGVYSELKGNNPGKTIILRADIDALPVLEAHECEYKSQNEGVMHACGHDCHAASLLSAVKVLAKHKDLINGTIKICFQQAEEIGYGARQFVKAGVLDNADRSFGVHVASNLEVGKITATAGPNNAAVDWFKIKVIGKGAHVSTPEMGVDALYVASQIVIALQAITTRLTNPMENLLIGIGKFEAGTNYNVVAENACLEGTVRSFLPEIRANAKKKIYEISESIAKIYGASVEIEWADYASPLINDVVASKEVAKVCSSIFGVDNVVTDRKPSLGGDDFADFILKAPGCYAFVGSKNDEKFETTVAHHNSYFDVDEKALLVATKIYVLYAIEYLNGNV